MFLSTFFYLTHAFILTRAQGETPSVENPFLQPQKSFGLYRQRLGYKGWGRSKYISKNRNLGDMLPEEYMFQYGIERNHVHNEIGGLNINFNVMFGGYTDVDFKNGQFLHILGLTTAQSNLSARLFAYLWNPETSMVKATVYIEPGIQIGVASRIILIAEGVETKAGPAKKALFPQGQLFLGLTGKIGTEWYFSKWVGVGIQYGVQINPGVSSITDPEKAFDPLLPKERIYFPSLSWGHMGAIYLKTTLF